MAVYNTDFQLTKRAIDSVLQQDFQDFELIIIDDGSTENDRKALLEYVEAYEEKIVYIRHRNRGQAESINRGVLNSVGEFITILDSDDEYKPYHLSTCLKEIENVDLICSTAETVVDTVEDYYVPDKNDLSKPIHLDDAVLLGPYLAIKKYLKVLTSREVLQRIQPFLSALRSNLKRRKYSKDPTFTTAIIRTVPVLY
jgi:glycosyltransferase involved in cell wall biosynthesis